jgi:uncharacterized membrane protein YbhN (UPF0104 family)/tRNA A-37 threonylcarbamoyl transferase component Bud32
MPFGETDVADDAVSDDGVVLFEPPSERRRLSAGDIIRLLGGLGFLAVGLVVGSFAKATIDGVESDVVDAIERLPNQFEQAVIATAQLFATFVPLLAVIVVVWLRRWWLLLRLWLASFLAGITSSLLLGAIGERSTSSLFADQAGDVDTPLVAADFPTSSYLASATAAVTVGVAFLPRRWKRAAWSWVVVLVVLRLLGPGQPPLDIWISTSLGIVIGSLVLLLLGSPNLEPQPTELLAGLRAAGLDPVAVSRHARPSGQTTYATTERNGDELFVKLRTPDDRSWDLLARMYRAIRLRSSEVSRPFSTLKRRVEHEALAMRTARDRGANCPPLHVLGTTEGGAVFLVEDLLDARPLSTADANEIDDAVLRAVFEQIGRVHVTRTAHHRLTLDNILLDEAGTVWIVDFDDAEVAATPRELARDVAEALVALGVVVGPERTVAAAVEALEPDAVATALPMLQPLALSRTLGRSIREQRGLLDRLRSEIHDRTGAEDVPLEQLARVQPRTLIMIMAGALAFYSLLPQFGNLGDTVDAFGDARWVWMPALLAAAAIYFVFATISFLGSVAQAMPIAASARSQVANAFAQLVGPASAGKMALAGRFLQRNGLSASEAGASVAINMVAGVTTHLLLMVGFFAWAGGADVGGLSLPSLGTVLLVVAIGVVLLGIAIAIPPVRRRLVQPVVDGLRTAAGYVIQVVRSPIRVLALLGGSTLITLSYLFGLVFAVEAFGGDLTIAQIGAAYLGAAAIANIAPTPGGIGPLEAAMIAGLTGFGLEGGVAISSVLTFRLATFWLPILPGWATFLWMERNGEI